MLQEEQDLPLAASSSWLYYIVYRHGKTALLSTEKQLSYEALIPEADAVASFD
jgi:hypothetical protein